MLQCLANAEGGLALTQLTEQVGLAPSTVHRLLATLEGAGFAYQDKDSARWYVGVAAFSLGHAFLKNRDYVARSRPFMRRLMEESGESVNLAALDNGDMIFLAQVECHQMVRMLAKIGSRAPPHASAVGKALLAALPERRVRELYRGRKLTRYTKNTITSLGRLRQELGAVRTRGYAVDKEEHAVGLRCVAATIHDEHRAPLAALSLSGPRARIPELQIGVLGALVARTAGEITYALGGRLPPWRERTTRVQGDS